MNPASSYAVRARVKNQISAAVSDWSDVKYCETLDENVGVLGIEKLTYEVSENVGTMGIQIVRKGGSSGILRAKIVTQSNSATENVDFDRVDQEVFFHEDVTSVTVNVNILNDLLYEKLLSTKTNNLNQLVDEYFHVYVENLHPTEALPATISRNLYGLHSPPMGGQNVYFYIE